MSINLNAKLNLAVNAQSVGPAIRSLENALQNSKIKVPLEIQIPKGIDREIYKVSNAFRSLDDRFRSLSFSSKDALGTIKQFVAEVGAVGKSLNKSLTPAATNLNNAAKTLNNVTTSAKAAKEQTTGLAEAIGVSAKRFASFAIAAGTIANVVFQLERGFKSALQFDSELVKFKQVGGDNERVISGISDEIGNLSRTLGVSSTQLIKTAVTLRQADLSAKDTKIALDALAKTTLAPTFESIGNTTEGVIAIMSQFRQGAGALEKQLGSINKVAADFPVESGDLVEAIRRAGGAFKAAGGDLNELLALFTSVRSTTRESAESIATAFRTIFARLQRGDTIKNLRSIGIELTDLQGHFIGPYESVRKLHDALKDLPTNDLRFAQLVENIGGIRQVSKVIPLIQQFPLAIRAMNSAIEGEGSLSKDAALAQEALLNKVQKLKESFLELFRVIVNDDSFKQLITYITTFAIATTEAIRAFKPLIPLLTYLAAFKIGTSILNPRNITGIRQGFNSKGFATGGIVPDMGNTGIKVGTDTVPMNLPAGSFVMRKSATQALTRATGGMVPTILTPGERVFTPDEAKSVGYSTLDKLNKAGSAAGGMVRAYADGGFVASVSGGKEITNKQPLVPSESLNELTRVDFTGHGKTAPIKNSQQAIMLTSNKVGTKKYHVVVPSNKLGTAQEFIPPDVEAVSADFYVSGLTKASKDKTVNDTIRYGIKQAVQNVVKSTFKISTPKISDSVYNGVISKNGEGRLFEAVLQSVAGVKDVPSNQNFDFPTPIQGPLTEFFPDALGKVGDVKLNNNKSSRISMVQKMLRVPSIFQLAKPSKKTHAEERSAYENKYKKYLTKNNLEETEVNKEIARQSLGLDVVDHYTPKNKKAKADGGVINNPNITGSLNSMPGYSSGGMLKSNYKLPVPTFARGGTVFTLSKALAAGGSVDPHGNEFLQKLLDEVGINIKAKDFVDKTYITKSPKYKKLGGFFPTAGRIISKPDAGALFHELGHAIDTGFLYNKLGKSPDTNLGASSFIKPFQTVSQSYQKFFGGKNRSVIGGAGLQEYSQKPQIQNAEGFANAFAAYGISKGIDKGVIKPEQYPHFTDFSKSEEFKTISPIIEKIIEKSSGINTKFNRKSPERKNLLSALSLIRGQSPQVIQRADGGYVPNIPNTGVKVGTDTVPAKLAEGSFVLRKSAADALGPKGIQQLKGYARGGSVSDFFSPNPIDKDRREAVTSPEAKSAKPQRYSMLEKKRKFYQEYRNVRFARRQGFIKKELDIIKLILKKIDPVRAQTFAEGGAVDTILTPNEYVFTPSESQKIGYPLLEQVNKAGQDAPKALAEAKGGDLLSSRFGKSGGIRIESGGIKAFGDALGGRIKGMADGGIFSRLVGGAKDFFSAQKSINITSVDQLQDFLKKIGLGRLDVSGAVKSIHSVNNPYYRTENNQTQLAGGEYDPENKTVISLAHSLPNLLHEVGHGIDYNAAKGKLSDTQNTELSKIIEKYKELSSGKNLLSRVSPIGGEPLAAYSPEQHNEEAFANLFSALGLHRSVQSGQLKTKDLPHPLQQSLKNKEFSGILEQFGGIISPQRKVSARVAAYGANQSNIYDPQKRAELAQRLTRDRQVPPPVNSPAQSEPVGPPITARGPQRKVSERLAALGATEQDINDPQKRAAYTEQLKAARQAKAEEHFGVVRPSVQGVNPRENTKLYEAKIAAQNPPKGPQPTPVSEITTNGAVFAHETFKKNAVPKAIQDVAVEFQKATKTAAAKITANGAEIRDGLVTFSKEIVDGKQRLVARTLKDGQVHTYVSKKSYTGEGSINRAQHLQDKGFTQEHLLAGKGGFKLASQEAPAQKQGRLRQALTSDYAKFGAGAALFALPYVSQQVLGTSEKPGYLGKQGARVGQAATAGIEGAALGGGIGGGLGAVVGGVVGGPAGALVGSNVGKLLGGLAAGLLSANSALKQFDEELQDATLNKLSESLGKLQIDRKTGNIKDTTALSDVKSQFSKLQDIDLVLDPKKYEEKLKAATGENVAPEVREYNKQLLANRYKKAAGSAKEITPQLQDILKEALQSNPNLTFNQLKNYGPKLRNNLTAYQIIERTSGTKGTTEVKEMFDLFKENAEVQKKVNSVQEEYYKSLQDITTGFETFQNIVDKASESYNKNIERNNVFSDALSGKVSAGTTAPGLSLFGEAGKNIEKFSETGGVFDKSKQLVSDSIKEALSNSNPNGDEGTVGQKAADIFKQRAQQAGIESPFLSKIETGIKEAVTKRYANTKNDTDANIVSNTTNEALSSTEPIKKAGADLAKRLETVFSNFSQQYGAIVQKQIDASQKAAEITIRPQTYRRDIDRETNNVLNPSQTEAVVETETFMKKASAGRRIPNVPSGVERQPSGKPPELGHNWMNQVENFKRNQDELDLLRKAKADNAERAAPTAVTRLAGVSFLNNEEINARQDVGAAEANQQKRIQALNENISPESKLNTFGGVTASDITSRIEDQKQVLEKAQSNQQSASESGDQTAYKAASDQIAAATGSIAALKKGLDLLANDMTVLDAKTKQYQATLKRVNDDLAGKKSDAEVLTFGTAEEKQKLAYKENLTQVFGQRVAAGVNPLAALSDFSDEQKKLLQERLNENNQMRGFERVDRFGRSTGTYMDVDSRQLNDVAIGPVYNALKMNGATQREAARAKSLYGEVNAANDQVEAFGNAASGLDRNDLQHQQDQLKQEFGNFIKNIQDSMLKNLDVFKQFAASADKLAASLDNHANALANQEVTVTNRSDINMHVTGMNNVEANNKLEEKMADVVSQTLMKNQVYTPKTPALTA